MSGGLVARKQLRGVLPTTVQRMGVSAVVRFNEKCYDRRRFLEVGIRHYDLEYEDGANPPEGVLARFLEVRDVGCVVGLWGRW
jgi:hypothetical protein